MTLINESLKYDNILAVFRAVVDEGCETRSEIAASTGLSIVTAGKAAEAFLDTGIFIQRVKQTKSVGRHAGRIRPNPNRNFTVIDLSKRNYSVHVYDLQLNCVYTNEYEYIDDFNYSDNLCTFLHRVKAYMLSTKGVKYNTICVIVPGTYEYSTDTVKGSGEGEIERIKIREYAKSMVGMPIDIVLDNLTAAVKFCAAKCRQDANILYINTDYGIDARLIVKGRMLKRTSPLLALPLGECGAVEDICAIIRFMCNISGVSEVIIDSLELRKMCDPSEKIRVSLEKYRIKRQDMPDIKINMQIKTSNCGAALVSRNYWLDKILK